MNIREDQINSTMFTFTESLWYIIPGASLLMSLYLFEYWINSQISSNPNIHTPIYTALVLTNSSDIYFNNWILSTIYLIILIGISYILGHFVSSMGTLFYERMLVQKGYFHPYKVLLGLHKKDLSNKKSFKKKEHIYNKISHGFYKGLFFFTYLLLISWYILFCADFVNMYFLILVGLFIIIPTIIKIYISRKTYRYKSKLIICFYSYLYPIVYNMISNLLSNFLHTQRPFDDKFIELYGEKFERIYGLKYKESGKNNYWLSVLYVMENSKYLSRLINFWENMYKFSRNLSSALLIAFLYGFISITFNYKELMEFSYRTDQLRVLAVIPIIYFVLSSITLQQYFYLYDNRYTRLVFRSFLTINSKNNI